MRAYSFTKRTVDGFTLAELLIALGILAVIATFTIPKVLENEQNARKKAIFKETISAISTIIYQSKINNTESDDWWNTGNNDPPDPFVDIGQFDTFKIFRNNMNWVKACNDALAEGCWTAAQGDPTGWGIRSGLVLHNGADMGAMTINAGGGPATGTGVVIDWNGAGGPNTVGDDQLIVDICIDGPCWWGGRPGTVDANQVNVPNYALWQSLWD